jgi:hypothetical protein
MSAGVVVGRCLCGRKRKAEVSKVGAYGVTDGSGSGSAGCVGSAPPAAERLGDGVVGGSPGGDDIRGYGHVDGDQVDGSTVQQSVCRAEQVGYDWPGCCRVRRPVHLATLGKHYELVVARCEPDAPPTTISRL